MIITITVSRITCILFGRTIMWIFLEVVWPECYESISIYTAYFIKCSRYCCCCYYCCCCVSQKFPFLSLPPLTTHVSICRYAFGMCPYYTSSISLLRFNEKNLFTFLLSRQELASSSPSHSAKNKEQVFFLQSLSPPYFCVIKCCEKENWWKSNRL